MQSELCKLLSQFCTISTGKELSSTFEILYIKTLIGLSALKTKSEDLGIVAAVKAFRLSCYSYLFSF